MQEQLVKVSTRVERLTRRWWLFALLALGTLLSVVGMAVILSRQIGAEPPPLYFIAFPVLFIILPLVMLLLYKADLLLKKRQGMLTIDSAGVWFNDRLLVAQAGIHHADHVKSMTVEAHLEILRRGPRLRFKLLEPVVERTLLYAMGCDITQKAARYRGLSQIMTSDWGNFLLVPASITGLICAAVVVSYVAGFASSLTAALIGLMVGLAALAAVVVTIVKTQVEVDASGIRARWLHKSWAFAAEDVVGVSTRTTGGTAQGGGWGLVEIHLRDRTSFTVPMQKNGPRTAALARRIELMIAHHHQTANASPPLLHQGRRSVPEWFRSLRGAGQGVHQHRAAPVDPNQFWAVVGRPDAAASDRVASAIALKDQLNDQGRAHLRNLAIATSEPRVRVVLDAIADDRATDEELMAALEATSAIDHHR